MSNCDTNITRPKRYIQYNDLVFPGRKSIDNQSESISLRENKVSRTFTNGSYVANKGNKLLVSDNTISLQIALKTSTWSEEHVQGHYDFIMEQLTTPGKLWAIQTGLQLVWCNAYCKSIQPTQEWSLSDEGYLVFKVEFDNPDGVWYKADENRVYLEDYDNCDFLDMKAECIGKTKCCSEPLICNTHCECCESKTTQMCDMIDYCTIQSDMSFINDFFEECSAKYRIVYNCEMCKQSGKSLKDLYLHTICDGCVNDTMTGEFLSSTVLPSHKWNFAIMGQFKDPIIRVNDVDTVIKGKYNGVLSIDYTGKIKYAKSWECMEYDYKEISLDTLKLCASSPEIVKGLNKVAVSGSIGDFVCLYINYEKVTI